MSNQSWRTFASFVLDRCSRFLPDGEAPGWFVREGHIVEATLANRIAVRSGQLLKQGIVNQYETELLINYPPVLCYACNSKGVNGRGEKCGLCRGEGKLNQVDFSEERVMEFIEFIVNCSGFDIC